MNWQFMGYVPFVIKLITQTIRARQTASARPIPVTVSTARLTLNPAQLNTRGDASIFSLPACVCQHVTQFLWRPKPKQTPQGQTKKTKQTERNNSMKWGSRASPGFGWGRFKRRCQRTLTTAVLKLQHRKEHIKTTTWEISGMIFFPLDLK